jgi:hypothetical protein
MTARANSCGDIDDIFWEAELSSNAVKDRRWIIPDKQDLDPPESINSTENDAVVMFSFSRFQSSTCAATRTADILVRIVEERGRGVWDVVGGEVWEASLLLSLWLRLHLFSILSRDSSQHVMELGCGVALPSLYISNYYANNYEDSLFANSETFLKFTLSDHDSCLLQNLASNIDSLEDIKAFDINNSPQVSQCLEIAKLDWTIFDSSQSFEEYDALLPPALNRHSFDIIYGSALCYAPCHKCLAYLIRYYLSGRCKEVIVIQIAEREGFQDLVQMLKEMNIRHTLEEVPDVIYDQACQISVSNSSIAVEHQDTVRRYVNYLFHESRVPTPSSNFVPAIKTERELFALLRVFQ